MIALLFNLPTELLIAIATAIGLLLGKLLDKFLARTKDQIDKDTSISSGLRQDLDRKETELANLKTELRVVDADMDLYRTAYWEIREKYSALRIYARQVLQTAGWSPEDIDEAIPALPELPKK